MPPRDEEYVESAAIDDESIDGEEDVSDDSDEYHALPSLPSMPVRTALAERTASRTRGRGDPDGPGAGEHDRGRAPDSAKRPRRGGVMNKTGGYSWEAAYKRSWDQVHEDESGNLESAVRHMLESNKRKRRLHDAAPMQRGIIRHFVLILDLSADMLERDLRPNRFDLTLQYARQFVADYFDQNPIGQLAILCTRDGLAERLSLMGGNTVDHASVLRNRRRLEPRGEPSTQNALEMARSALAHLPSSNTREVLFISASLTSVDPGNIHNTIDQLVADGVQVSVISLAAEMHILRELCERTGGEFGVVLNEDHYLELLQRFVPPRVITHRPQAQAADTDAADLFVMGFPRRLPFNAPAAFCACHGRIVSARKASDTLDAESAPRGYTCLRCASKVCQVPTDCPVCGITIIMSTHLARSYHHLFPVKNYLPMGWGAVTATAEPGCFACNVPFPPKPDSDKDAPSEAPTEEAALAPSSRYRCPRCQHDFCLECDAFIQEQLHQCPGCT